MDQVKLSRLQLRELASLGKDIVVTATNEDWGSVYVEHELQSGLGRGKWMLRDGKYRKETP